MSKFSEEQIAYALRHANRELAALKQRRIGVRQRETAGGVRVWAAVRPGT